MMRAAKLRMRVLAAFLLVVVAAACLAHLSARARSAEAEGGGGAEESGLRPHAGNQRRKLREFSLCEGDCEGDYSSGDPLCADLDADYCGTCGVVTCFEDNEYAFDCDEGDTCDEACSAGGEGLYYPFVGECGSCGLCDIDGKCQPDSENYAAVCCVCDTEGDGSCELVEEECGSCGRCSGDGTCEPDPEKFNAAVCCVCDTGPGGDGSCNLVDEGEELECGSCGRCSGDGTCEPDESCDEACVIDGLGGTLISSELGAECGSCGRCSGDGTCEPDETCDEACVIVGLGGTLSSELGAECGECGTCDTSGGCEGDTDCNGGDDDNGGGGLGTTPSISPPIQQPPFEPTTVLDSIPPSEPPLGQGAAEAPPATEAPPASQSGLQSAGGSSPEVVQRCRQQKCQYGYQRSNYVDGACLPCLESVKADFTLTDVSYDDFVRDNRLPELILAIEKELGLVGQNRVEVFDIRPGSVVATVVILPKVSTSAAEEGDGDSTGEGVETEIDDGLVSGLDTLLSSEFLPGFGRFAYTIETGEQLCGRWVLSKEQVRELIAINYCNGTDGACNVLFGNEVKIDPSGTSGSEGKLLLKGFDGGAPEATQLLFKSILDSASNDSTLNETLSGVTAPSFIFAQNVRSMTQALLEVGRNVTLQLSDEMSVLVEGGVANFSTKNCTECVCISNADANQPFIQWKIAMGELPLTRGV